MDMVNLIQRIKSLPVSTKRLLGLGTVLGLFVALPLFIWAVVTQTFLFKERAATGEPGGNIPVNIATQAVSIQADDFKLVSHGETFTAGPNDIVVASGHATSSEGATATIEISSTKPGETLKARFVFRTNYSDWWVSEVSVLDPSYIDNWVTFSGTHLLTSYGQPRNLNGTFSVDIREPVSHDFISQVTLTNLHIEAFNTLPTPNYCSDPFIIDINPQTQSGTPGQTLRYDVNITNNKNASCGSFTTHLIIDHPSNWSSEFGTETFVLSPNHTYSTHLDITSSLDNYVLGENPLSFRISTEEAGNMGSTQIFYNLLEPSSSPSPVPGDANGDGHVNIIDIGIIIDNYRSSPPDDPRADLNGDGIVNIVDIGIIIDNYEF